MERERVAQLFAVIRQQVLSTCLLIGGAIAMAMGYWTGLGCVLFGGLLAPENYLERFANIVGRFFNGLLHFLRELGIAAAGWVMAAVAWVAHEAAYENVCTWFNGMTLPDTFRERFLSMLNVPRPLDSRENEALDSLENEALEPMQTNFVPEDLPALPLPASSAAAAETPLLAGLNGAVDAAGVFIIGTENATSPRRRTRYGPWDRN